MAVSVTTRVGCVVLLAACSALCQERALPDAPSAVASAWSENQRSSAAEDSLASSSAARTSSLETLETMKTMGPPSGFALFFHPQPQPQQQQNKSNNLLDKYLYSSLLKRNLDYHPSTSDSLAGRAVYAASRIFVTRDETGRGRLNTSYLVGVLGAATLHMAYRPYWARSGMMPFSDFGSAIGNDAGMNLLHEFRPGLEQMMKNHTPRFVSRIEQRIGRN